MMIGRGNCTLLGTRSPRASDHPGRNGERYQQNCKAPHRIAPARLSTVSVANGSRHNALTPARSKRAETDLRLKRLYDAIEAGVADLDDPALKGRIANPKAIRDQARAVSERAAAMLETSSQQSFMPQMVQRFARTPASG
jgi:hypothetical protein